MKTNETMTYKGYVITRAANAPKAFEIRTAAGGFVEAHATLPASLGAIDRTIEQREYMQTVYARIDALTDKQQKVYGELRDRGATIETSLEFAIKSGSGNT